MLSQRVVARGAAEAMETLKKLREEHHSGVQESLAARKSPRGARGGWEGQLPASAAIGTNWEKTTLVNSENFLPPVNGFPSAYICKNARKKYF